MPRDSASPVHSFTDPASARGRLLAKAAHLFREKGYERTTVRDLAAEVGIQSGSIFHHFRTKEEILKAVMTEAILVNTERMRERQARAASTRDAIEALVQCELESINGDTGEAMAVLVYEWRSLSEPNRRSILKLRDIYEGIWLETLTRARDEGLVRADPFVLRRFLTGALSWTITWFRADGDMSVQDLATEVMAMLQLDQ